MVFFVQGKVKDMDYITLVNGRTVSENDIRETAIDYIQSLDNPEDIKNRIVFSGCIRHIYKRLFQPDIKDIVRNNRNSLIDYGKIDDLIYIYNAFIDLCCLYKQEYTTNKFLTLVGLSRNQFNDWLNNKHIPEHDDRIPNVSWSHFAKKIKENSEAALSDSMLSGNLMAYAQLKCWYNWTETPQQIVVNSGNSISQQTLEQIAERRKKDPLQLPEKP